MAEEHVPSESSPDSSGLRGAGALLWTAAFLLLLLLGARTAWKIWGGPILAEHNLQLSPEHLEITPPPSWIQTDIKQQVVRHGGLRELPILDKQLTVQVARAFAAHSWVARVVRVHKRPPNQVFVELKYRQPVAMVEVQIDDRPGLLPVDREGVLLPPQDFTPEQARGYLRISLENVQPAGPAGAVWEDLRVVEAARLAAVLQDHWRRLNLYQITANSVSKKSWVYETHVRSGARIIWGSAPQMGDASTANDPQIAVVKKKLQMLEAHLQTHGPLDDPSIILELETIPTRAAQGSSAKKL